uniref:Transposase n=1 Tax=Ascaris lumbricoides TaxID=6252 RepID=A0A0M3HGF6_ASCLU
MEIPREVASVFGIVPLRKLFIGSGTVFASDDHDV